MKRQYIEGLREAAAIAKRVDDDGQRDGFLREAVDVQEAIEARIVELEAAGVAA